MLGNIFYKGLLLLISSLTCKEIGSHHSTLTTMKTVSKLKSHQFFLDHLEKGVTGKTAVLKLGEIDRRTQRILTD